MKFVTIAGDKERGCVTDSWARSDQIRNGAHIRAPLLAIANRRVIAQTAENN